MISSREIVGRCAKCGGSVIAEKEKPTACEKCGSVPDPEAKIETRDPVGRRQPLFD